MHCFFFCHCICPKYNDLIGFWNNLQKTDLSSHRSFSSLPLSCHFPICFFILSALASVTAFISGNIWLHFEKLESVSYLHIKINFKNMGYHFFPKRFRHEQVGNWHLTFTLGGGRLRLSSTTRLKALATGWPTQTNTPSSSQDSSQSISLSE